MSEEYKAQDAQVLKAAMQKDYVNLQSSYNKAMSARIADIVRDKYNRD